MENFIIYKHSLKISIRKFIGKFFLILIFNLIFITNIFSQFNLSALSHFNFRDIYGHLLPMPAWPPADSAYEHNTLTIWFNNTVINHDYLCNYWWNYRYPPGPPIINDKDKKDKLQDDPIPNYGVGCFPLNHYLFTDSTIYNTLDSLGVVELCQYSMLSPCEDSLSMTHYGYTIRTPQFWNSFYVTLNNDYSLQALLQLLLQYGGTKIDFAELNTFISPCEDTLPHTPNDSGWIDGLQTAYLDTIFGENITGAWKYEHGQRAIKVAIIDKGINYTLPDLGGVWRDSAASLGCDSCRVVNGREYLFGKASCTKNWGIPVSPYWHGIECATIIGARANNNNKIAGIAGGWSKNDGVSLYSLYMNILQSNDNTEFVQAGWSDAFIFSSYIDTNIYSRSVPENFPNHEKNRKGFGVNIISNSNADTIPSEELKRAIDFAYFTGTCIFSGKDNYNSRTLAYPADFEYNKVISVGAYSIEPMHGFDSLHFIPTRWYDYDRDSNRLPGSNYGFGLDILGFTNHDDRKYLNVVKNYAIDENNNYYLFTMTSAATPQVAGVGALILSKFKSDFSRINFFDFENGIPTSISYLAPEDVQGLLCISARDLKYFYGDTLHDTVGYDAETGYGMLRGGEALQDMLPPYQLHHYRAIGGDIEDSLPVIDPFVVLNSAYGDTLLTPTSVSVNYKAIPYLIRKKVPIFRTDTARSWGRGGFGTIGWSCVQPCDGESNTHYHASGYCRVVGDAIPGDPNFNPNNIRDISFRNDTITLETYCMKIWDISDTNNIQYLGWYPVSPDSVIYRFTVWGRLDGNVTGVNEDDYEHNPLKIKCHAIVSQSNNFVKVNYELCKSNKADLYLYDDLGKLVYTKIISYPKQSNSVDVEINTYPIGAYYIVIHSGNDYGFCKFTIIR